MRILIAFFALLCTATNAQPPDLPHFPYPVTEVAGHSAVATWQEMRTNGRGTPVIVGSADNLANLAGPFDPSWGDKFNPSPVASLAKAQGLTHPQSLRALHRETLLGMIEWAREQGDEKFEAMLRADLDASGTPPEIGEWPSEPMPPAPGPVGILDWQTGQPYKTVYIVTLPTDDPSEVPAYLRLGNWNAHPPAAYHVAAFRSWLTRYGAVPMVITHDIIEFQVERPPVARDDAIALAVEQYQYCSDIVDQGTGSIAVLASSLQSSNYWFFWWD